MGAQLPSSLDNKSRVGTPLCRYLVTFHSLGYCFRFQIYHMTHMHKRSPGEFLESLSRTANLKICPKCIKKCYNPLILALHHDRHHLTKPLECPSCRKNFLSPASFYREDRCRKNSLPGNSNFESSSSHNSNTVKRLTSYSGKWQSSGRTDAERTHCLVTLILKAAAATIVTPLKD